jgi:hypothetical protein
VWLFKNLDIPSELKFVIELLKADVCSNGFCAMASALRLSVHIIVGNFPARGGRGGGVSQLRVIKHKANIAKTKSGVETYLPNFLTSNIYPLALYC